MKKYQILFCTLLFTKMIVGQNNSIRISKALASSLGYMNDSIKVCVYKIDTLFTANYKTEIKQLDSGKCIYLDKNGVKVYAPTFDAGHNGRGIRLHTVPNKKAIEFERKMKVVAVVDKYNGIRIPTAVRNKAFISFLDTFKVCVLGNDTLYTYTRYYSVRNERNSGSGMLTYYNKHGAIIYTPLSKKSKKNKDKKEPEELFLNPETILYESKMKIIGFL